MSKLGRYSRKWLAKGDRVFWQQAAEPKPRGTVIKTHADGFVVQWDSGGDPATFQWNNYGCAKTKEAA